MIESTYIRLLDTFTWAVLGLIIIYMLVWILQNFNVSSIKFDQNYAADDDESSEDIVKTQPETPIVSEKPKKGKKKSNKK